jgi:hypothetical protein
MKSSAALPNARGRLTTEAPIRRLRTDPEKCADKYHDTGTNDFLIDLMEKHEKMAWMLRTFLHGETAYTVCKDAE